MISLQTLPALILWVVVAIRLIGLRFGWKLGILPAMTMVAMGASLNIDEVYLAVDPLLGGWNLLNLIVHLLMGAGMTELSRLLLQASGRAGRANKHVKILIATGFVLALVQVALLAVSGTQGSATNFTDTFGSIPTVALYSATFFAWIAIVLGYTGVECLRRDNSGESRSFTIGFKILSVGCLAGLAAISVKMLLIGLELAGIQAGYMPALYLAYRILIALTIVGFAVGFMLPSYGRIKEAFAARRKRAQALDTLRPIVRRLAQTPEGKRSMDAANINLNARTSKVQVYRWFIFIGDIRVLGPDLLSAQETRIIDEIGKGIEHYGSTTRYTAARV
ncbi:UNVERIFIED_ORG: hypothetical protein ABIB52_000779 [Arthrobacter sp. UYCu721]